MVKIVVKVRSMRSITAMVCRKETKKTFTEVIEGTQNRDLGQGTVDALNHRDGVPIEWQIVI